VLSKLLSSLAAEALDWTVLLDVCWLDLLLCDVQYFSPYLSADMVKMAEAFNTTVTALEEELMQLILDGKISARIDSHNKAWLSC